MARDRLPQPNLVQPLLSGRLTHRVLTPAVGTQVIHEFSVPLGGPMGPGQAMQYAPAPELSLWAGIQPSAPIHRQTTTGSVWVETDMAIEPYDLDATLDGIVPAAPGREQKLYVHFPFEHAHGYNVVARAGRIPWPVGAFYVRMSMREDQAGASVLGPHFTFVVAWAACSVPSYPSLPIDRAVAAPSPRRNRR